MLTMKQARKEHRSAVRTQSFKAWARATYAGRTHVSPKLGRILRSATAAAA